MSFLYDLKYLKSLGFKDPSKFKYNGKSWSAWYSKRFNQYLIKNHTDDTKPITISNWVKTIYLGEAPEPTYSTTSTETPASNSLNYEDYKLCLVEDVITEEFLNYLEIETFYEIYKTHPNISTFDFSFCNSKFHLNKMYGKRNILFFDTGKEFYGKFKFNSQTGWLNIKGTKNLGAFFKNKKSSRTLILCEGLKDGINANIAFPSADILVTDSKTIPFKFEKHQVEPKQYQKIILAVDRDVTANEQLNLLFYLNANFYKKVFPIDWNKISNEITDFTEWIKSLNFSLSKYRKNGLSTLKRTISNQNFYNFYIEKRVQELDKAFQNGKENLNTARRIIKIKNLLGADLSKEAQFLIESGIKSENEEILNLNSNGKLSNLSRQIIDIVDTHQRTLLNAPTGTGKSYLVKNSFPAQYKNIIIISPLRMVTDETSLNSIFQNVKKIEDINSPYISITTDIFQNLSQKYPKLFNNRVQASEIIIFDEQHLYKESKNFRDKVIRVYEYLLYRFDGKVLFMSGTPVIPKDVELKIITAKVPNSAKKIVEYSKDGFENIDEMVTHIKNEIQSASVMVYCSSKQKVEEVTKLLIKNRVPVFSMTSIEIRENGLLVKDKKIKFGNYAYISTTKATTGITIPNLKGIYQYGTAYNPNTFIQLLGRLRNGGFVHYIQPKFEHQQEKFLKNHTIGVVKGFQKLNVTKLSNSFNTPEFQDWIQNNFYIPFHQKDLQGFLNHFREALQIIEAKGLGHFTIERDDYIFNGAGVTNVDEIFDTSDTINFEKYIDRIIIDWINQNDVELLNKIYNLSFVIKEVKYQKNIQKMELISLDDKEQKREKRKKFNSETKEFYNQLEKKFQGCLPLQTLKKSFSLGELTRLNEMDIDLEEIKNIKHQYDKIVLLKSKMIPIKEILQIAKEIIGKKGYCTLKELDIELQKVYIVNSRNKSVYFRFLVDIFTNEIGVDLGGIKFMDRKKINDKQFRNLLVNYN